MAKVINGATKDPVIHQRLLEKVVRKLFVGEDIKTDVRKEGNVLNPATGKYLELDIYIPRLKLCFEFQDSYHYTTTWYSNTALSRIKEIDHYKRKQVEDRGEHLISVPCWWDGSPESLVATIRKSRSDLFPQYTTSSITPIPAEPPAGFFHLGGIKDVGELMLASFPADSGFYKSVSKSNPWWQGEKYDGIRFCWHSGAKKIFRRSGHELVLPSKLYTFFTNIFLDGELWFGRGFYTSTLRLLKPSADFEFVNWPSLRFVVFDTPSPKLRNLPFEERYKELLDSIVPHHPLLMIPYRVLCNDRHRLVQTIKRVIQHGGEGVILRKPKSVYESGRSDNLLKLKAAHGDKEAVVVKVEENGSMVLKLPDESEFTVPAKDVKSDTKPVLGDIVTFSYEKLSRRDAPTNPKIIRIRSDLLWENVLTDHSRNLLNDSSQRVVGHTTKPYRYWRINKGDNIRKFFVNFARERGLDPFDPNTWYTVPYSVLQKSPGGETIMGHLRGGLAKTLIQVFPQIGIDESQFAKSNTYWRDERNRRKVFDQFAAKNGFDPLNPDNWYSVPKRKLLAFKGIRAAIGWHRRQLIRTLVSLYPELQWDPFKFARVSLGLWANINNRKRIFLDFAKKSGFNPLVAENWYSVPTRLFLRIKGASGVLHYYQQSYKKALMQLFPEVEWDASKFKKSYRPAKSGQ